MQSEDIVVRDGEKFRAGLYVCKLVLNLEETNSVLRIGQGRVR
jgi:hypothetical protein